MMITGVLKTYLGSLGYYKAPNRMYMYLKVKWATLNFNNEEFRPDVLPL